VKADIIPTLCAGTDLDVANAARRSFDTEHQELVDGDVRLIHYLVREGHWLPFRHPQLSFSCEAPVFVARQLGKHQVGMDWSEISRRYKTSRVQFWEPTEIRQAPENAKQGTGPAMEDRRSLFIASRVFENANSDAYGRYLTLLDLGVAPEQARAVLSQSMYVYWTWTGSLLAWLHLIRERTHHLAQRETTEWASLIIPEVAARFPAVWQAVTQHTGLRIPNDIEAEKEGKVLTAADIVAAERTPA